jgi:hypothetical protein
MQVCWGLRVAGLVGCGQQQHWLVLFALCCLADK